MEVCGGAGPCSRKLLSLCAQLYHGAVEQRGCGKVLVTTTMSGSEPRGRKPKHGADRRGCQIVMLLENKSQQRPQVSPVP